MNAPTASRSTSYPAKVKSPPWTTHRTSKSGWQKQHELARPLANPKLSKVSVNGASQRAGAAR
eukprot:8206321-Alexandrium_andersonii.AAC.1